MIESIDSKRAGPIPVSDAASRTSSRWDTREMSWEELSAKLREPVRLRVTSARLRAAPEEERHALKDVGGWVGGRCRSGSRKSADVLDVRVIRLDMDAAPSDWRGKVRAGLRGFTFLAHTTASHRPEHPRVRVVVPLLRPISPEEYGFLSRRIAADIGPDYWPDRTTFRHNQMSFWPSIPSDGEFLVEEGSGRIADPDAILAANPGWEDLSSWPLHPERPGAASSSRAEDPTAKRGWVGAFCRAYDVHAAIATFLPSAYVRGSSPDRYSHVSGSLRNGLVVYDGGRFAYSHHALSDPAAGRLVNSWDLVRIHLYLELDAKTRSDTPTNRLPSYLRMVDLARGDADVLRRMAAERVASEGDFEVLAGGGPAPSGAPTRGEETWFASLALDGEALPKRTLRNLCLILRNDRRLSGIVRLDLMAGVVRLLDAWGGSVSAVAGSSERSRPSPGEELSDRRVSELRVAMEALWRREWSSDACLEALRLVAADDGYHPVRALLDGFEWDGIPRLDRWLVDLCGAEDSEYVRQSGRKFLCAAIARIRSPGCKFDHMLLLHGEQGTGKSSACRTLALEDRFFAELRTVDPRVAAETISGIWWVEMSELDALSRSDANAFKAFVTVQADRFRPAYGRVVEVRPRTCVVIGTTNEVEVLKDQSGNRRFWPIHTGKIDVASLRAQAPQLYAEADRAYASGESLWLEGEAAPAAAAEQESHRQVDPWEETIAAWLELPAAADRYDSADGGAFCEGPLVPRNRVCVQEILVECLGIPAGRQDTLSRRRVAGIMRRVPGWGPSDGRPAVMRFGRYGSQRGWNRQPAG